MVPSEQSLPSLPSILESGDPLYMYSPDLSNLALQNMNLAKFNDLSRISEEGEAAGCAAAAAVSSKYSTAVAQSKYRTVTNAAATTAAAAVKTESSLLASTTLLPPPPIATATSPREQYYVVDTSAQLAPMMDKLSVVSEQVIYTFSFLFL